MSVKYWWTWLLSIYAELVRLQLFSCFFFGIIMLSFCSQIYQIISVNYIIKIMAHGYLKYFFGWKQGFFNIMLVKFDTKIMLILSHILKWLEVTKVLTEKNEFYVEQTQLASLNIFVKLAFKRHPIWLENKLFTI